VLEIVSEWNSRKSSERRCGRLQQGVALFDGSPRRKENTLFEKSNATCLWRGKKQNMLQAEAQALPHATAML